MIRSRQGRISARVGTDGVSELVLLAYLVA